MKDNFAKEIFELKNKSCREDRKREPKTKKSFSHLKKKKLIKPMSSAHQLSKLIFFISIKLRLGLAIKNNIKLRGLFRTEDISCSKKVTGVKSPIVPQENEKIEF